MSDNSGNGQRGRQLRKKKEPTTTDSSQATEQPSAEQLLTEPPAARDSGNESLLDPSIAAPSSASSSANMGDDNNNKQAVTAANILSSSSYLLLPDFIDKSPTAWVRLCKAQFIFLGITDEEAQYTRVLAGLPPKLVVDPVIEIIDSDFAQGHMDKLFAAIVDAFTTRDRHHHHPHLPDHYQHWLPAANGSSDQLSSSAINSSLDGRIQELPKLNPTTSAEREHQSQPQAQTVSFTSEFVSKLHHNNGVNNSVADAPSRAEAITSSPFTLSQLNDEQKDLETLVVNGRLNSGLFEMQPSVRIIICKTEHKSSRHLASGTLRRQVFDPGGGS